MCLIPLLCQWLLLCLLKCLVLMVLLILLMAALWLLLLLLLTNCQQSADLLSLPWGDCMADLNSAVFDQGYSYEQQTHEADTVCFTN